MSGFRKDEPFGPALSEHLLRPDRARRWTSWNLDASRAGARSRQVAEATYTQEFESAAAAYLVYFTWIACTERR